MDEQDGRTGAPQLVRTLLVWCPDWSVIAAEIIDGIPAHSPVAVLHANRVVVCSPAARAEGVRRGLRKREAQSRCPRLVIVEHDPGRDVRAFEPVVVAVEEVAVGVEVIRPGTCAMAARGPARYFASTAGQSEGQQGGGRRDGGQGDGEARAAERIVEHIAQTCAVESQVGIADGVFAAGLAARTGRLVPPGHTRQFLAGIGIEALDRPQLTDLLRRLGVRTLGDFAALPRGDVLTRFGFDAALAHRLAAGEDHRPLAVRRPPPDLEVTDNFEEPIERVDMAAFAARALAERLHEVLAGHGLACTRLSIEAVTAHGEELHRTWRHDGLLTATAIADRVRWQLDGWLSGPRRRSAALPGMGPADDRRATELPNIVGGQHPGQGPGLGAGLGAAPGLSPGPGLGPGPGFSHGQGRPTAGILRLRLIPEGVIAHMGQQPGLWGDAGSGRDRARRALNRIQGMLGPEAVVTPVLSGGRSPAARVRWVPWGDERTPPGERSRSRGLAEVSTPPAPPGERSRSRDSAEVSTPPAPPGNARDQAPPPWPGRLPPPAPAVVLADPLPAAVYDLVGAPVTVSARLQVSAVPASLAIGTAEPVEIIAWSGPWPVDERWWDWREALRQARFQVCLADGQAMLLALNAGAWRVEAIYD